MTMMKEYSSRWDEPGTHEARPYTSCFPCRGVARPRLGFPSCKSRSGVEPVRARSLLQILLRDRRLVKISEDLIFHRSALDALRELLA